MRFLLLCLFFLANTVAISAQNTIDKASVNFKIKNIGVYVKATFSESAITGNFNPDDLENSVINATVQVNSVDTGIAKRDKHLLEAEYFDAVNYPTIQFASSKIEKKSATNFILHGKLTIKNKSKTVQLPLTTQTNGNSISVNSTFTLSRKDYGVGGKSWVMSDKVKAEVQFIAIKP